MIQDIFKTSIYCENVCDETFKNYFIDVLNKHINENKGRYVSNMGGFQTLICKFNDSEIEKKIINDLIISHCSKFLLQFKIKKEFQLNNLNFWINKNFKGSFNKPHNHGFNSLSGVYYLKVPKNSGNLVFLDLNKTNNDNFKFFDNENFFAEYTIEPKEFDLILFFSETMHYVQPNNSDESRISMAFNIDIKEVDK